MTASAQLGVIQQGQWQLAAPPTLGPYAPPAMPTSARPWMAHLYNNDWSFRASLGAIIGQRPTLIQTLNSGFQPVTVEFPAKNSLIQPGNLIVITEEGGDATGNAPAGLPMIGGTVESVPSSLDVAGWKHEVVITPFVAELGDAFLNKNYTTATDVAQMVRDAVGQSKHLRYTWQSIPNTGVTAIYNFSYAPALEVIDHCRLIAGTNYSWFVDAIGVVWFQAINTTTPAMFTVTPKDFSGLQSNGGDISGLKNYCLVVGGLPSGASVPATATYNNATSQTTYGLRAANPPISVPTCTDVPTLQLIANTVGGIFDRVINRVTIDLPAYSQRLLLGQPAGATMRYFSPSKYPMQASEAGSGGYSANYVVLSIETDGIQQRATVGDVPLTSVSDVSYQVDRLASRTAINGLSQPPLVPGMKVSASSPSSLPLTFNDGTRDRVQIGNLSAFSDTNGTISPAHWGVRQVDGNGVLISDTTGLSGVFVTGGTNGPINLSVSVNTTTYTTINSITFSLTRTSNLFVWSSSMRGNQTVGTGTCTMGVQLDGLFPSGASGVLSLQGDVGSNFSGTTTVGPFALTYVWPYVAPGIHTLSVVAAVSVGTCTYSCSGVPNYFVLGG